MELLLYGRIGHYEKCVERIRQHSARSAEEEMAARLLQKLTRGRRGRAKSEALASSARAFAATLGAATSMQARVRAGARAGVRDGVRLGLGLGLGGHLDAGGQTLTLTLGAGGLPRLPLPQGGGGGGGGSGGRRGAHGRPAAERDGGTQEGVRAELTLPLPLPLTPTPNPYPNP